jgi:hypothetical protein
MVVLSTLCLCRLGQRLISGSAVTSLVDVILPPFGDWIK